MAQDHRIVLAPRDCLVHAVHRPGIDRAGGLYTIEDHHVFPMAYGGPKTGRTIAICPTGHTAIHELLRVWLKQGSEPSWEIRQKYHPNERMLAREGFEAIQAHQATSRRRRR